MKFTKPFFGARRTVTRFALFPTEVDSRTDEGRVFVWLEWYVEVEEYAQKFRFNEEAIEYWALVSRSMMKEKAR